MREHEPVEAPYWQHDLLIGEGRIQGERASVRRRTATASWEDIYAREVREEFLRSKGYQPFNERAFVKRAVIPPR